MFRAQFRKDNISNIRLQSSEMSLIIIAYPIIIQQFLEILDFRLTAPGRWERSAMWPQRQQRTLDRHHSALNSTSASSEQTLSPSRFIISRPSSAALSASLLTSTAAWPTPTYPAPSLKIFTSFPMYPGYF